jgi:hypothetical protein
MALRQGKELLAYLPSSAHPPLAHMRAVEAVEYMSESRWLSEPLAERVGLGVHLGRVGRRNAFDGHQQLP